MNFAPFAQGVLDHACEALIPKGVGAASSTSVPKPCVVAVIGFAGSQVRGAIGVSASPEGLQGVAEGLGASDDDLARFDALGELANLILGAVKREWARRGVLVTISTPQVLRGLSIEVCGTEDRDANSGWFEANGELGGNGHVSVWLDVRSDGEVELTDASENDECIDQGDAILF